MPKGHMSDCSLHIAPAMRPKWCDCGGHEHKPTFLSNLKDWAHCNYGYFKGKIV
ncbi:hypothetical protein EV286_107426 [Rhizobium sp. BK251]|nr:hypothetical protein EV286_107426 [Rhizobium sp. BK251]